MAREGEILETLIRIEKAINKLTSEVQIHLKDVITQLQQKR